MRLSISTLARWMAGLSALVIAVMPFHAFLTVWIASLAGHYTLLRLWKEVILAVLVLGCLVLLMLRGELRRRFFGDRLVQVMAAYLAVIGATAAVVLLNGSVSRKAAADGLLLDSRFIFFFLAVWLVTQLDDVIRRRWRELLLIPATAAIGFATLQWAVLPHDFLRHFGYGPATIPPTETVDQNKAYSRVQSTLRGANPFGAYLVVILSALGLSVLRLKRFKWQSWHAAGFAAGGLALFFTFSRSAWLGALASLAVLLWLGLRSARLRRTLVLAGCTAVLVFAAAGYSLRNNDRFQNIFFHTSEHSQSPESSNEGHAAALREGLSDIVHHPLGGGPGSAGPASVYNKAPARIAENYFIQIGQELGILGLGLFAAITVMAAMRLWRDRRDDLQLVLFASFIGLIAVNMLSHAWTDDTLAYIWWGLAGAALAPHPANAAPEKRRKNK